MKYKHKYRNKEYKALLKMGYTQQELELIKSSIAPENNVTVLSVTIKVKKSS